MYLVLYASVSLLLKEDSLSFSFFGIDEEDKGSIKEYDTNIKGRFRCLNEDYYQAG